MFQNSMDNLSIELQQNFQGKSNQQILQQFQQITRRIAQSDRNNIIYRQIKKKKGTEYDELKKHINFQQPDNLEQEFKKVNSDLLQAKTMIKKRQQNFELLNKNYQTKHSEKQKQLETKYLNLNKDNQKIQKKYQSLQEEYEHILKSNKDKISRLQKLKKQKEQKNKQLQANELKIQSLQKKCQLTKTQAQKVQKQVKRQREIFMQLKRELQIKQQELNQRQIEKDQVIQKQQQTKKSITKMMISAKNIEQDIDRKMNQMRQLQKTHLQLESYIVMFQQSQRRYDQLMMKRKEMISNLRKCNIKIVQEKQANDQINSIKNQHQQQ